MKSQAEFEIISTTLIRKLPSQQSRITENTVILRARPEVASLYCKIHRNLGESPLDKWERHLAEYMSFLKELAESRESSLRFGRKVVAASDIAAQFFCEKKVEMQYLYGEVETEAKIVGTEAHGRLLEDAVRVKTEELWQKIYGRNPVLALESLFFAKFNDIIVAGKPDSILFKNGLPLVVLEHKFSRTPIAYETHHVQARIYGLLLNNVGFDTRLMFYAIIVADPAARSDRNLKKKVLKAIDKNGPKEGILELDNARVFLVKYNHGDAEKDLNWAIKFWKQEREAIPTQNPNKCKTCEYFEKCQVELDFS
jgi:PD-(D/E)XK nuclease superfamily